MSFDIEKLEKNLKLLQALPGISFRKRADKVTPLFSPDQIVDLENVILSDIGELVMQAIEHFKKLAKKLPKPEPPKAEPEPEKPEPEQPETPKK